MKKVSAKMFFTVMWRGVWQVVSWFLGLFGFKKNGCFAKFVWGMFATSAAVIATISAVALVWAVGEEFYDNYYKDVYCYDPDCYLSEKIGRNLYFHDSHYCTGYIFNAETGKKVIKHVTSVAEPNGNDSLVCFNNGEKQGYFSLNTGKVVIEPKYDHAWEFSEGLASVDDGGTIKFIDVTGKVVIDNGMPYVSGQEGLMFHGSYCQVFSEDGNRVGLMDKTGRMVLPMEYDAIYSFLNYTLWNPEKGNQEAMLDSKMKEIIPMQECSIYTEGETIDVTMPDHTIRKYDMQGQLIHDFYISSVRMLEYEKEEIIYRRCRSEVDGDDGDVYFEEIEGTYHPKATAKLRAYVAGDYYEGLMTADGHIVTMPLYKDIDALNYDLYLCTSTNDDKVIVNGKGEIIR